LSEDAPVETKKDYQISEFGINGEVYISADVGMDMSSDWINKLSTNRNPEFENVRIFMKRIVDGRFQLFRYDRNEMRRFFFRKDNGALEQLIYKRYFPNNEHVSAAKNNYFRQQLRNEVTCDGAATEKVENVDYDNDDLVKYFNAINQCNGSAPKTITGKKEVKGNFNLAASVFWGQHRFHLGESTLPAHDFGSKTYVSFGAEAEYVLPVWNNKWSTIGEVSYNKFEEKDVLSDGGSFETKLNYILFSVGFRHYFFLSPKSQIFANVVLTYEAIGSDSFIQYKRPSFQPPKYVYGDNSIVPAIGAGYKLGHFLIEFRYDIPGNPSPYPIEYKYTNVKAIVRYQFL